MIKISAFSCGCNFLTEIVFTLFHVEFNLTPVCILRLIIMGTQNLPHAMGERHAKEIIFTGRPFTAQEAFEWGLVNKVCEPATLIDETLETARRIAANAPLAVQRAKRATTVATQVDRATGYQFELEAYNRLVGTEDRTEGVRAFNEKRKPDFKGK